MSGARALRAIRRVGEAQGKGRFGEVLRMSLRDAHVELDGASCAVRDYVVPARLATPERGALDLGAVLALFDEVSSFGVIAADATHRWGVSVSLGATRLSALPRAGDTVTVASTAVRLGRNLGFCDCALRAADGAVLARGRHTKFLPTGIRGWDALMAPPLRPLFLSYVERLGEKDAAPADLGAMAHVDDAVPLDGSTLRPGPLLSNPMGMPHGGALCISASRAAARGDDPRSMHAEFLASRQGALDVAATATSATTAEVVLSSGSARVFQASLAWDA